MIDDLDGYCERLGPGLWAEPLNAATNLAFVLAALGMAGRARGMALPLGLCAVLGLIGAGSGLFHTVAKGWAALADVIPILLFILAYLYAANRHYLMQSPLRALLLTAGFVPYAAVSVPLFALIPGIGSSAGYAPVPLLILIYAGLVRGRLPVVARGLAIGAGLLILSLVARTLDMPLCPQFPYGTHFIWHLMNALMLALMIETLIRHMASPVKALP